jgi:hypothetical protein
MRDSMENWKDRARQAKEALREAGHGKREATLEEFAGGVDISTVRRWVSAIAFLDRLQKEAPDIRRRLENTSFSEVDVLARWHVFDVAGALDAAREVAEGKYSSRRLTAAMHRARQMHGGTSRNESFEEIYRRGIENKARLKIVELLGRELEPPEILAKDSGDPPADFTYATADMGQEKRVAAIIAGPYTVANTYFKRRFEWVGRALALAWSYDDVVILVPEEGALPDYEKAVKRARTRVEAAAARANESDGTKRRLPNVHALYPGSGPTNVSPAKDSS